MSIARTLNLNLRLPGSGRASAFGASIRSGTVVASTGMALLRRYRFDPGTATIKTMSSRAAQPARSWTVIGAVEELAVQEQKRVHIPPGRAGRVARSESFMAMGRPILRSVARASPPRERFGRMNSASRPEAAYYRVGGQSHDVTCPAPGLAAGFFMAGRCLTCSPSACARSSLPSRAAWHGGSISGSASASLYSR